MLHRRHRAGPHGQPEIEPKRGEHNEDEIEHGRPEGEDRLRVHLVGQAIDDDAGQRGLDQRIGEASVSREVPILGDPPAQKSEREHFVGDERADRQQRKHGIDAAAEQPMGEIGEDDRTCHRDGKQHRQDDRQRPHALLLAAQDLASQRVAVTVCRPLRHRVPS